jgi:proteic killer suppression protein
MKRLFLVGDVDDINLKVYLLENVMTEVILASRAEKDVVRAPAHIVGKFKVWVAMIEFSCIREVRKIPGWHDKPLQGARFGQRSVRLNRSWRVIYRVIKASGVGNATGVIEIVEVLEVNHHEY